jgi:segregation and condensation protein A
MLALEEIVEEAAQPGFAVCSVAFSGDLGELARALRTRALPPEDVDVFKLVRDYLSYYQQVAARNLELATETLPQLARVIELKARLLLPRPPEETTDETEEALDVALEAVDLLAELEAAIQFLKQRREARRIVLPARAPRPAYPRPERPPGISLERLSELASRHQAGSYFELALERLSVAAATAHLTKALQRLGRGLLTDLAPAPDWPSVAVSFLGMLELVKEGKIKARQAEMFAPIELELLEPGD